MSEKLNSKIAVIGIDIGKNSIHIVGQDRRGALVLRQKLSRGQVEARLANLPPCLIGMEACTGAHHLSRKLQALKLMTNSNLVGLLDWNRISRSRPPTCGAPACIAHDR
jgi:hypothetical protein